MRRHPSTMHIAQRLSFKLSTQDTIKNPLKLLMPVQLSAGGGGGGGVH
jgi:hypothetical protein